MTSTTITTDTQITENQNPTNNNAKLNKGYIMKRLRPHNLIIGSDSLFTPRHKEGFSNTFRDDHNIFMLESYRTRDNHEVAQSIQNHLSSDYDHKIYMGYKQDTYLLFDLYLNHNIVFDAAVLINGSYTGTIYMDPQNYRYRELSEGLATKTKIYNIYGKLSKYEPLEFASVNQQITTILPAHLSSRFALEAYGLIVYDLYEQMYLPDTMGRISYL